ncbi:aminopeptidase P family protein [Dissulfurirhabdus thermomarina]|uniref:Aminopeptidase P family protein n=2 Tax=Dissulfurirhabdus thermomarina TaxID=1765737 RepID=A0A6N9TRN8_DISTH|nr:aminopeptidase P family protein [Dissulfurirhabdus thermomarina]NMX22481.1 aminopeptidase P family protein [Dissulfurirhabdus thermomarina]
MEDLTSERAARQRRLSRFRSVIRARGLDGFLVTSPENRRYLSGFRAGDPALDESAGWLLVLPGEQLLFTDGRYEVQARSEAPGWHVVVARRGLARALGRYLGRGGVRRLAFEPDFLTVAGHEAVRRALPGAELVALADVLPRFRAVKDPVEAAAVRRALEAAEAVFEEVAAGIRPGVTEREVAWRILEGLHRRAEGPSFPPIVASGPNGALPHAEPGDRPLREGEPVVIDMGARLGGYCSDMTRTVFLGRPDPEFARIYGVVRRAQLAAQGVIRAGLPAREADAAARRVIREAGYGERFVHALGHGVGLAVHEAPGLSPRNRRRLQAGMVVTVEPGIYLPGRGGVRLENMVLVTAGGAEVLGRQPGYLDLGGHGG